MTERRRSGRRQQVYDALRSSETPMSIVEIAHQVGLHPNTARFHLQSLTESGQVERVEPSVRAPGRPPLMFCARPGMDPAGPRNYHVLAAVLASRLGAERGTRQRAVAAGREWGLRHVGTTPASRTTAGQAKDRLIEILGGLGFSPRRRTTAGETRIELTNCPFLDLVPEHQDVICPVHLGLMQGALEAMDAGIGVEQLVPFAEPDLCIAHLAPLAVTT